MAKPYGQRTVGEKIQNAVQKKAGEVTGRREIGSSAPAVFPAKGAPRLKPTRAGGERGCYGDHCKD